MPRLLPHFALTDHAIRRVMQRVRRDGDYYAARAALREGATRAVLLPERTPSGERMWSVQDPPMRLITKHDNGVAVIVTVYPAATEDDTEEVVEAWRRVTGEVAA